MIKRKIFFPLYKKTLEKLSGRGLRKIPGVKLAKNFAISQLKTQFAEVQGHKMFLGKKDSLRLSINGIYEEVETGIVKKEVKSGEIVLDVGANIGYYTLILAKLVGSQGRVYAFEPEPTNFEVLKKNIEMNGYQNVILNQSAVGIEKGRTKLYLSEIKTGMHRIYKSKYCKDHIEVDIIKLDDYLTDNNIYKNIDFVKIDVEGAELAVLEGMQETLNSNQRLKMLVEFVPESNIEFGVKPFEVLNFLKYNRFKIYCINDEKKAANEYTNINEILKDFPNGTNLFCVKK